MGDDSSFYSGERCKLALSDAAAVISKSIASVGQAKKFRSPLGKGQQQTSYHQRKKSHAASTTAVTPAATVGS